MASTRSRRTTRSWLRGRRRAVGMKFHRRLAVRAQGRPDRRWRLRQRALRRRQVRVRVRRLGGTARRELHRLRTAVVLQVDGVHCGHCGDQYGRRGHRVPAAQWDKHYGEVRQRVQDLKTARRARDAAAQTTPPRPPAPPKPAAQPPLQRTRSERRPMSESTGQTTNGRAVSSQSNNGQAGNGQAIVHAGQAMVEAMRSWAMSVPASIPQARHDADAMATVWVQIADMFRQRALLEGERNKIPPHILEPLHAAANQVSRLGGAHQEVVRQIDQTYGSTAAVLARPDTPTADYLSGGR